MVEINDDTRKSMNAVADIAAEFSKLMQKAAALSSGGKRTTTLDSETLKVQADSIRNDEFQVVVCGKFKNGKSTFINAVLGREMMAAKATACTAVITVVSKGSDEDHVKIIYNDKRSEILTMQQFTREYQLTESEQAKIDQAAENEQDIVFDRFRHIDHVEMQSMHPMLESGCSLIDTPGLEEALSRDKTTTEYLPKANAIIFVLNASSLFSRAERQFIEENFANKHKTNVFFVVNRIDSLTSPEQLDRYVTPTVKNGLKACFTDGSGRFDEELYNKRVFFLDSLGALRAATQGTKTLFINGQWVELPVDIAGTGMVECQNSLMEFINSPDRRRAMFISTVDLLAGAYRNTLNQSRAAVNAMVMTKDQKKKAADQAREALRKAENDVAQIENAFIRFGNLASETMYTDLLSYFDRSIRGEYPAHVKSTITAKDYNAVNQAINGVLGTLKLIPVEKLREWVDKHTQDTLQPIMDDLSTYVEQKMELWRTNCDACIRTYANDLEAEIRSLCTSFSSHIEASVLAFSTDGAGHSPKSSLGDFQKVLVLLLPGNKLQLLTDINNEGSVVWSRLVGKIIGRAALNLTLTSFSPSALFLSMGVDLILIAVNAKNGAQGTALTLGEEALKHYRSALASPEYVQAFKDSVKDDVDHMKEEVSAATLERLEESRQAVNDREKEVRMGRDAAEKLQASLKDVQKAMLCKIGDLYKLAYGRSPTESEMAKLVGDGSETVIK